MANNLCCILDTFLKCEGCNQIWCEPCWYIVGDHEVIADLEGAWQRRCGDRVTLELKNDPEYPPFTFKLP